MMSSSRRKTKMNGAMSAITQALPILTGLEHEVIRCNGGGWLLDCVRLSGVGLVYLSG